jgi:F0F1-type ATP synthase assembly protein I
MMQAHLQEMVQRITRFSLIALPVVALGSLIFREGLFALNILLGGIISLLSFRTVVWTVRKFMNTQTAQPLIMGISVLKILAIGLLLLGLMLLQVVLPVPLLAGFTLVLVIVVIQGIITARKVS